MTGRGKRDNKTGDDCRPRHPNKLVPWNLEVEIFHIVRRIPFMMIEQLMRTNLGQA